MMLQVAAMNFPLRTLMAAVGGLLLVSCQTTGPRGTFDSPAKRPTNPSAVRVKISTSNQAIYVMEGGKPLLVTACTVGTPSTPTPMGNFNIYSKQKHRRKFTQGFLVNDRTGSVRGGAPGDRRAGERYVGYPMGYWCEFKPAYGIHAGWVWPYPKSHGCVRIHFNVAPSFFALVKEGTPLNIARTQPEDATLGKNLPRPQDYNDPEFPSNILLTDKMFNLGTEGPLFVD
jgi:hypothetical protein